MDFQESGSLQRRLVSLGWLVYVFALVFGYLFMVQSLTMMHPVTKKQKIQKESLWSTDKKASLNYYVLSALMAYMMYVCLGHSNFP